MGFRNKNLVLTLMLVFGLLSSAVSAESSAESLFKKGNDLYSAEKYSDAITAYEQLIDKGVAAPELYYNLGNAFYKSGIYPKAILNYERALRLSPGDADIEYNLKMANLHSIDKIEPLPEVFYEKWIDSFIYGAAPYPRAVTGIVLFWLALIAGVAYVFLSGSTVKKITFTGGTILLFAACFTFFLTFKQHRQLNDHSDAIVFSENVYVKSSPDEGSANLFMLHSGTKVKVLDQLKDWKKIRIANGNEGWISSGGLESI
ncbi:MAG TPA: tetratricopeptide repeat protein [Bacteroidia bacterium]|nr:tetratricopeptide repeat protein [Bacteroidia bacterium]